VWNEISKAANEVFLRRKERGDWLDRSSFRGSVFRPIRDRKWVYARELIAGMSPMGTTRPTVRAR